MSAPVLYAHVWPSGACLIHEKPNLQAVAVSIYGKDKIL